MKFIDDMLNNTTMYRLVLYVLIALLGYAVILSFFGLLPFSPYALLFSTAFLLFIGWATNTVFASVFETPANVESFYISALILALIISPIKSLSDLSFLFWAAVLTMASKFILAIHKKHIFNPVALAVYVTSVVIGQSATWWVGTAIMFPVALIGGILIVRKIRRADLFWSFIVTAIATIGILNLINGISPITTLQKVLLDAPLIFFATVMLTEPLTTPPTKGLRIIYGAIVGFLFSPQIHLGNLYTTPESALLLGNLFSYAVSPKEKLLLTLREKIQIAPNMYDFVFALNKPARYTPGQYMEWTVGHNSPDSRGNRRYFTLSSSPTENTIRIGIRFYESSSSYKRALLGLTGNTKILAGQLAGDFTLPCDKTQKLVFIAGGIGVTPYRSMVKYLLDTGEKRTITLLYSNKTASEICYSDVFNLAQSALGMKAVYTLTDAEHTPANWQGRRGRIDAAMIREEIPDYRERMFYLSGPNAFVTAGEKMLRDMGVPGDRIKTDFFPGFA